MSAIDNAVATAKRLIERYGEACTWRSKSNTAGTVAWKPGASRVTSHDCRLIFLRSKKLDMKAIVKALGSKSEITDGQIRGLLAGDCGFTPSANDEIIRSDGSVNVIHSIDPLAPNGSVVFYEIGIMP